MIAALRYGQVWSFWHGGKTGNRMIVRLRPDEAINGVQLWVSSIGVHSIQFMTNKFRIFGPFGGSGGNFILSKNSRCALTHLSGASGDLLDSLTLHYECPKEMKLGPSEHEES